MGRVVEELQSLAADVEGRDPTLREKMAAGGFLSSFYMGVENVLKRISRYRDAPATATAGALRPEDTHFTAKGRF